MVDDLGLPLPAEDFAIRWGEQFFSLVDRSNHDDFRTLVECEHESLRATVATFGRRIDTEPYVRILEDYWRAPPIHGDVLDAVARLPLPVCIVSNADAAAAHAAIAAHGLRFDHIVTSEDARCYKPCPAIFEYALQRTGWRRERVVHVGDSLHSDIAGAHAAGLRSAWICRDERIHDIGSCTPHHRFCDLLGLVDLFNGQA